jgi:PAS domain S-box-containing protein
MSGSKILLAMDNTLETEKVKEILSSTNYQIISIPDSEKNHSINLKDKTNTYDNISVDLKYFNQNPVDLILMDELFENNQFMENILKEINKEDYIPIVYITSILDDTISTGVNLKENTIYLNRPFKPKELLLTLEMAFYKRKMDNALTESEDKYRLLIENADDPISIINYEGKFIMVNPSAARFFGWEKEKFPGKTMWELFPKEKADSQMKNIRNVIETGKGGIFEDETIIKGKKYYFSTNIQPMPVKNGEPGIVQLIARDITSMKTAENALKKSEEKFREVFNNANDGVSLHTIDEKGMFGKFSEVNDVVCQRLGYSRDELLEMSPKDLINQDTKEKLPEIIEKLTTDGMATFEAVQVTKSGESIITEISNHLFNLQGKQMIMSISRDISQRKKSEDQLLRILAGIEGTGDAIGISMPDGSHFYHNQSFNELFGYSVEELNIPLGPVKLFADHDLGHHIFQTIMNGNSWNGELEMINKEGRTFPTYIRANAIKNQDKKIIGLIGVLNDITERKNVEYALKTSEEKFRNVAETAVDAIINIDIDEKIVFCNRSLERIFDYRKDEIIGEYLDTLIPTQYIEDFQVKFDYYHQHDLELGNVFESFGRRKDGSEFPLEMSLNTWKTEGGIYTTFIIRDTTQRKLDEFKLKMREDIFHLMSQNIDEVFWIIDPLTGQILYMSPSYQIIWGRPIENLYENPRSWIESIHSLDKDKFIYHIFGKNGNTTQDREGIKCRVIRPDGNMRWIKVRAFPVINQNKEIYRRIGIATDISNMRDVDSNTK